MTTPGTEVQTWADIPRDRYLAHAFDLDADARRSQQQLLAELSAEIIDAHVHTHSPEHATTLTPRVRQLMLSTFSSFSLSDSARVSEVFFPGKRVRKPRMCPPFVGIDHRAATDYLLRYCPDGDRVAAVGTAVNAQDLLRLIARRPRNLCAVKMYPLATEPPASRIVDVFSPSVLARAERTGLPIVLHLPAPLPMVLDEVFDITARYPRLTIVLAHLGLINEVPSRCLRAYERSFETLASMPTVVADTAMVLDAARVALAIGVLGWRRVLFGTDEPLSMVRAHPYEHPDLGPRLASHFPYHWVIDEEHARFGHRADTATHLLWRQLRALLDALGNTPSEERHAALVAIFFHNVVATYGFACDPIR